MLSVFLKVVLFVPSPNYSCPASSACCSYHYCSPTSLACCEFVIACKACKVLYYTCSHYCDCHCITLVRIWLLLFEVLCCFLYAHLNTGSNMKNMSLIDGTHLSD